MYFQYLICINYKIYINIQQSGTHIKPGIVIGVIYGYVELFREILQFQLLW